MPIPPLLATAAIDIAPFFMELGAIFLILALAGRVAGMIGLSPIPFYLLIGLVFSNNGLIPVSFSQEFIQVGAEIGVLLLLFVLGLEYTPAELSEGLRRGMVPGVVNFTLNFTPGVIAALLLEWDFITALLLGGVTFATSSGIVSKLLGDLGWLGNRETPVLLSLLVVEDLMMAVYLPLMSVLLIGAALTAGLISLGIAIITVVTVMFIAMRWGGLISRMMDTRSNEILLLTVFAAVLLVAGVTQELQVSAAVGAFLIGIALSDPIVERVRDLMTPLRDVFAAAFFVFFGLQLDPATIPPMLGLALGLGAVTGLTKIITGIYAARRAKIALPGQFRVGTLLTIRGEFSIVIVGLATAAELDVPDLISLTAAYVLVMAVIGSVLVRIVNPIMRRILQRRQRRAETAPFQHR